MSKEKQIESTDWLTRGIPKEQLEREKQEAIMSADLGECLTEFGSGGEIYTDYDATAEKMCAKGYRKQREGEWVEKNVFFAIYKCSICGAENLYKDGHACLSKFCPNCGAKMKGGAE